VWGRATQFGSEVEPEHGIESISTSEGRSKMKYVYFFGAGKADGTGDMRDVLGGKGAGLAEMTKIGLPVPAGFTITTEACEKSCANRSRKMSGNSKGLRKRRLATQKIPSW
jgi:Pyruvate phosphate dikinase, AMP/ATP-binding domain